MDDKNLWQLLGQAGIGVGALVILARVVWRIGERMIAAIDRVGAKIDEHTKHDTEALAGLRQDVAVLSAQLAERGATPVEGVPVRQSRPVGTYAIKRRDGEG